jgi:hypothetical protein
MKKIKDEYVDSGTEYKIAMVTISLVKKQDNNAKKIRLVSSYFLCIISGKGEIIIH